MSLKVFFLEMSSSGGKISLQKMFIQLRRRLLQSGLLHHHQIWYGHNENSLGCNWEVRFAAILYDCKSGGLKLKNSNFRDFLMHSYTLSY